MGVSHNLVLDTRYSEEKPNLTQDLTLLGNMAIDRFEGDRGPQSHWLSHRGRNATTNCRYTSPDRTTRHKVA